ncbi:hypothetical protein ID47_01745 [Candidatus Paracaedibacter acanthamoebae]|uniref:Uncharacterized protein n=1 Tax=Candidatus Odyssella acanthamoebae TaxID=91604 RepID=A0A077AYB5_9PROT|nr:hypothetical protein ID47_01745 [Candidatus Paracaedibacter acanthamoebae]
MSDGLSCRVPGSLAGKEDSFSGQPKGDPQSRIYLSPLLSSRDPGFSARKRGVGDKSGREKRHDFNQKS